MTKYESRETKTKLIAGLSYLVHELKALQSLTDVISFDQAPPGGRSASDQLYLISYAQSLWLDPLIHQFFEDSNQELVIDDIPSIEKVEENLNFHEWDAPPDFGSRLQHVISHREALLKQCERFSETYVSRKIWISAIEEQRPLSDIFEHFFRLESDIIKRVIRFISDIQSEKIMLRSAGIRKMEP